LFFFGVIINLCSTTSSIFCSAICPTEKFPVGGINAVVVVDVVVVVVVDGVSGCCGGVVILISFCCF